jgi:6-phosphogluconolactonase
MPQREIKILPDPQSLTEEAARRIIAAAQAGASENQRVFSLFLSGGNTPKSLYELLAAEPYRSQVNWSKLGIFFGDERCVPPDHPDSNYRMARNAMLCNLSIPESNIHRMRGEANPEVAAGEYGKMLKSTFGDDGADMVLLGMGPDGHTASLFPGTNALKETHHRCVANFVPKFDSWRITLTYPFLNKARSVIVLVVGEDKAEILKEVLEGPRDPGRLPIQGIEPAGQMTWLLDTAAASRLKGV